MANLLLPVGRMVAGSVYKPNDKDFQGNQLTIKSGPNAGKPRIDYFIAVAIPKTAVDKDHWANSQWGQIIWAAGHQGFPNGEAQRPDFAWKVEDGDSRVPNRRGIAPCTKEGYPGHWVVKLSSGFAPRLVNANGTEQLVQPDAIKCGYYIQVYGTVDANGTPMNPGVFINHQIVALAGYGPEIINGPDPTSVGFGGQLPPGASTVPVGGGFNPAPQVGMQPQRPMSAPGVPMQQHAPGVPQMTPSVAPSAMPQVPGVPGVPSAAPVAGNYMQGR